MNWRVGARSIVVHAASIRTPLLETPAYDVPVTPSREAMSARSEVVGHGTDCLQESLRLLGRQMKYARFGRPRTFRFGGPRGYRGRILGWSRWVRMRGRRNPQASMLTFVDLEARVPSHHPLRTIKRFAERALAELSPTFDAMYGTGGRPSIPQNRLRTLDRLPVDARQRDG